MERDPKTGELYLDTAFEARVVSIAIGISRGDLNDRPYLSHHISLPETIDEVEFFNRQSSYGMNLGRLTVRRSLAEEATRGFKILVAEQTENNTITAETAKIFLSNIEPEAAASSNDDNKIASSPAPSVVVELQQGPANKAELPPNPNQPVAA